MNVRHVEHAFEDARGWIADILENEPIEHVSIIVSVKGSVRGNHYHAETYQWLYLLNGSLRYSVQLPGGTPETGVVVAGDVLLTEPIEWHAMEALEDTTMLVLTRGPRGGQDYESDTFRLTTPLIPAGD